MISLQRKAMNKYKAFVQKELGVYTSDTKTVVLFSDYEQDRRAKLIAVQDATDELARIARDYPSASSIGAQAIQRIRVNLGNVFGCELLEDSDTPERRRDMRIEHSLDKLKEDENG